MYGYGLGWGFFLNTLNLEITDENFLSLRLEFIYENLDFQTF